MTFGQKVLSLNFLTLFFFLIDRLGKWFVIKKIPHEEFFLIWPFKINFNKNEGAVAGLKINQEILYVASIIILLILIFLLVRNYQKRNFFLIFVLTFIIGGAVSNLIDRLIYGGVIDFIDFFSLSTFNLADGLIIVGIGLWIIKELIYPYYLKRLKQKNKIVK